MYAPINAYQSRMTRDAAVRAGGSPSRPGSRSASISSRQAATPPRGTPPREFPGAFPSGSPRLARPASSSSSRQSSLHGSAPSTPSQQPVRLAFSPTTDYQHYSAEPFQYQHAGRVATAPVPSQPQPSPQPQYARRVVSGPAEGSYTTMPRRVPVPVQRATAPVSNVHGSYSDPALGYASFSPTEELGADDILVDVVPQNDSGNYRVQTVKSGSKNGESSSSGKDGERRRRSGRSRRKN